MRAYIDILNEHNKKVDDLEEGVKNAAVKIAMGAAALVGATTADAKPSAVDPEIVAASGDTARTRPSKADAKADAKAGKEAPKPSVDAKARAKKFHLDLK
jgi:hypothetical protein